MKTPKRYQLTRRAANASWSNRTAKVGEAHMLKDAIKIASKSHGTTVRIVDTANGMSGDVESWGGMTLGMRLPRVWFIELGVEIDV